MFTDVSGLLARNPSALHAGIAVADGDGDGAMEFVVAGFGGPNRVLKWVRGQLLDVTPPGLADPTRVALGVAAGDVDGDGREELLVSLAGPSGPGLRLFDAKPDGAWVDLFARHNPRHLPGGRSLAALDRRGTGRYGFVVAGLAMPPRLYELGSDGRIADRAPTIGLDRPAAGRGLWVGPLVSDRSDVVCINEFGPNHLYVNRGDGTYDERAVEHGLADEEEHGRGGAVLDADGRLNLVWVNWHGPHRLAVRQIDGSFRDAATLAMALPGAVQTVVAADFDNDGFEELFFHCLAEPNRLFGQRPEWRLLDAGAASEPEGHGTGAAVADIDGDGVLELLLAHGETAAQPLSLFKVSTRNAWLRVKPLTRFGAPARGALVKLRAAGRTQVRVIDGGSGYLCQMEPVAHFGLGELASVESLTVLWPDGTKWVGDNPPIRTMLEVPYPGG